MGILEVIQDGKNPHLTAFCSGQYEIVQHHSRQNGNMQIFPLA